MSTGDMTDLLACEVQGKGSDLPGRAGMEQAALVQEVGEKNRKRGLAGFGESKCQLQRV